MVVVVVVVACGCCRKFYAICGACADLRRFTLCCSNNNSRNNNNKINNNNERAPKTRSKPTKNTKKLLHTSAHLVFHFQLALLRLLPHSMLRINLPNSFSQLIVSFLFNFSTQFKMLKKQQKNIYEIAIQFEEIVSVSIVNLFSISCLQFAKQTETVTEMSDFCVFVCVCVCNPLGQQYRSRVVVALNWFCGQKA